MDVSNDAANPIAITGAAPPAADKPVVASPVQLASTPPIQAFPSDDSLFVRSNPVGVAPFPIELNHAVKTYVDQYLSSPEGLERSFRRSSPYMPEMVSVLREHGLPSDLVYLTFAESGFSDDGAGPWQLSRGTARRYGLVVNNWVDERRDPVKSTRAAAAYLTDLHAETGNDWRMTLVAWNNGENGVNRYLNWSDSPYDRLLAQLPYRTRSLLNRFMAVAFIAHQHRELGVKADTNTAPTYKILPVRGGTPLKLIAQKVHASLALLRELNPGLIRGCTPPTEFSYPVRVPQGLLETSL
ncbi:MAG TPA: lytic transglycosylase domain-containing protein [Candidatus Binataceae bacterium]|nr:lytic transglycosylase domain-containing protein [Candidatus Binataceae bacterium]